MKWRCLVASAAVWGAVAGCQAEQAGVAVAQPPAVQRSQKPDAESVKQTSFSGLLNKAPDTALERADGQVVAAIRATVNGVPILEQEVLNACYASLQELGSLPEPERTERANEVKQKALEALIERELILQDVHTRFSKGPGQKFLEKLNEAADKEFDKQVIRNTKKKFNCKNDEELKQLLRSQGVTLDGLRRQFQRQFIYQQYLQFLVQPHIDRIGHQEIEEYYRSHPEEFQAQDSVDWQDIFIAAGRFPTREAARLFAEGLRARARAGEDFAALARQHDMGTSSYQGGEGIGHRRGEIRPREVEPYLFQMRQGDVGELVELESGFHVIRVAKRDYAGQKPFNEETQEAIRDKLRNEVFNRESKSIVADLRRKATIDVAPQGAP
jgi:peptidyl-prolyl cis-trans isomerase SurA